VELSEQARHYESQVRNLQSRLEQASSQVRAKEAEMSEQARHHEGRVRDMQSQLEQARHQEERFRGVKSQLEQARHHEVRLMDMQAQLEQASSQVQARDAQLSEQARHHEGRLRILQSQLDQVSSQIRAKEAELSEQARVHDRRLRDMQSQLEQARHHEERFVEMPSQLDQDSRSTIAAVACGTTGADPEALQQLRRCERQCKSLNRTVQDQKKVIGDLEHRLSWDHAAVKMASPGEFLRMSKAFESESVYAELNATKRAFAVAQAELDECKKELAERGA